MASVKLKFQPVKAVGNDGDGLQTAIDGRIVLQVSHNSLSRHINTDYYVRTSEWDRRSGMFVIPVGDSTRTWILGHYREALKRDVARLRRIIASFENDGVEFSIDDIVEEFRMFGTYYSLSSFMIRLIESLKTRGYQRTSETYSATLRSFMRYRCGRDLMLDCLTSDEVMNYESYLRQRGLTPNTTSFYMRILRAVYNRAVADGGIQQQNPFRNVYTGVERTRKRALSLADIRRLTRLDLRDKPELEYARDIFMLSFYTRGMSLIDMAHLKKSDLSNGHILYRRRKTGQALSVAWTQEMQYIVDKYSLPASPYLFPLMDGRAKNTYAVYRNVSYRINRSLKKIGLLIGCQIPLTLYCARHSWASIAQAKNIPVSVISAGMGHNSELTTRIYLAALDVSAIDKANNIILKALR